MHLFIYLFIFSCGFLTSIMVLCLNLTTFVTNWSDCYCWNVSWRLFLSEEMTVTFPMQIKLVFTDLPWVCIFIQLRSSNTAWWVPDRSPDTKDLHTHHFCTEHGSNLDTTAKISYYWIFVLPSFVYQSRVFTWECEKLKCLKITFPFYTK